jgi:hypothetical protein
LPPRCGGLLRFFLPGFRNAEGFAQTPAKKCQSLGPPPRQSLGGTQAKKTLCGAEQRRSKTIFHFFQCPVLARSSVTCMQQWYPLPSCNMCSASCHHQHSSKCHNSSSSHSEAVF